jgi:CheY-like chemotaxis protein
VIDESTAVSDVKRAGVVRRKLDEGLVPFLKSEFKPIKRKSLGPGDQCLGPQYGHAVPRKAGTSLKRPRILLADDHGPMIEEVRALLQPDFEIVGDVGNGLDLVSEAGRLRPDIIVLDIAMPEITGIEAAHKLREAGSSAILVFLTMHERVEFVRACLAEGALGYVIKSRVSIDLVPAITDALAGRRFISPPVSR